MSADDKRAVDAAIAALHQVSLRLAGVSNDVQATGAGGGGSVHFSVMNFDANGLAIRISTSPGHFTVAIAGGVLS